MAFTTLIEPAELLPHLSDRDWVVVDCRFDLTDPQAGPRLYAASHIPGARYAHLNVDLSGPVTAATGRHPLPDPARFAERLGTWGIGRSSQVVAYDEASGATAARLWWMLRWVGHRNVAVLNGGLKAWLAAGHPVNDQTPVATPSAFIPRVDSRAVLDVDQVVSGLAARTLVLVDARASDRFAGRNETIDAVAGHVPGARNHPFLANVDTERRFLQPTDLQERWRRTLAGAPDSDLVCMCGSGVTACHNLLALEIAGVTGARLYAGSWSEWIRDERRPVEKGEFCYRARNFGGAPEVSSAIVNSAAKQLAPGQPWKIEDSLELYQVQAWGKGYFGINAAGHVVVRPDTRPEREIDLLEVVEGLKARDLRAPLVVRFSDILAHRLRHLHDAFASAIAENEYKNRYAAVFPIKVNQQRLVVEEVYRYGAQFGFGLEVGSKPELLAVMALTEADAERIIICNGFKDDSYIEAVILATKLGRAIVPVVENFSELQLILKHSERYQVRPRLGVRVKLASEGAGRWRESAGERSKFGLFITEILELFETLKRANMLDCLQLVHCHPGSQLQDIRRVKDSINELAHVYAELKIMGAGLQYIDVGGGLGVDYDGSGTNFESSMNYTLNEYASDVVYRIASVCNAREIPHPMIISESGRAIAAHHSVLVFNTLGSSALDKFRVAGRVADDYNGEDDIPQPVHDLFEAYRTVSERRLVECYHDALQAREQALQMFNLGYLSLEFRGLAERLYWATCAKVRDCCRKLNSVPEELENLEPILSDTYFCNFSVFQSLPDSWAIGQLFPIMPIHRLAERPTRNAVLADITCDSDGKIDRFVSHRDVKRTLELHELKPDADYYLAAFLVGAYQETLGDLHNLFGDTHVVHIRLHDEGGWWIEEIVKGDTANRVLEYMEYDVAALHPKLSRDCERAVREGRLSLTESQALKRFYEGELNGYAYLEPDGAG